MSRRPGRSWFSPEHAPLDANKRMFPEELQPPYRTWPTGESPRRWSSTNDQQLQLLTLQPTWWHRDWQTHQREFAAPAQPFYPPPVGGGYLIPRNNRGRKKHQ